MHGNLNLDKGCYMSLIPVKNKVRPRNYSKKLNQSSSTEKLGMHFINKLQRLGISTEGLLIWAKVIPVREKTFRQVYKRDLALV